MWFVLYDVYIAPEDMHCVSELGFNTIYFACNNVRQAGRHAGHIRQVGLFTYALMQSLVMLMLRTRYAPNNYTQSGIDGVLGWFIWFSHTVCIHSLSLSVSALRVYFFFLFFASKNTFAQITFGHRRENSMPFHSIRFDSINHLLITRKKTYKRNGMDWTVS